MQTGTWKKIATGVALAALGLVVLGLAAPRFLDLNRYHDLIVSELEKSTGGRVTLGNLRWGLGRTLWLEADDFSIADLPAVSGDLRFTRIHARISIPALLTRTISFEELQLKGPEIRIRLEKTGGEKDQPPDDAVSGSAGLPFGVEIAHLAVAIDRLEVSDGLTLPGETLVHVFSDAALSAAGTGDRGAISFDLSLDDKTPSGLGSVKARGTLSGLTRGLALDNPELRVQATLDEISSNAIEPYLKSAGIQGRLSGRLSVRLDYAGDLGRKLRAHGSIDLARLVFSDPGIWDNPLSGLDTSVAFQFTLDPKDLTVEKITVSRGALSLNAQGRVHDWSARPSLSIEGSSSALSLHDLAPLVPWKQLPEQADLIRTILDGGGTLELSRLALAETPLERLPATAGEWLSHLQATARVAGVSLPAIQASPAIGNITGTVSLVDQKLRVEKLTAQLASIGLPPVSGEATDLLGDPKIHANVRGALRLDETTDEQVYGLLREIGAGRVAGVSRLEAVSGLAELDLTLEIETARPADYQLRGTIGLKDFLVKTAYTPALFQAIDADIHITPTDIQISRASANLALSDAAKPDQGQFSLGFRARIDDWKGEPSVTLEALETSSAALPLLSAMIPWDQLDFPTREMAAALRSGGFVTITALALPAIALTGPAPDPKQLLAGATFAADLDDVSLPGGLLATGLDGISGQVGLKQNRLLAEGLKARIGPVTLPATNIRATDVAGPFRLVVHSKGPLSVVPTRDRTVAQFLLGHGLKSLDVSAEIDVTATYDRSRPEAWTASGSLDLGNVDAVTYPRGVALQQLTGQLRFQRDKTLSLTAQDVKARIDGVPLQLSGTVSGIGSENLLVKLQATTSGLDLERVAELAPALGQLQAHGVLDLDADVHVPYSKPDEVRLKGTLRARDASLRLPASGLAFTDTDMDLRLDGNSIAIKRMATTLNGQKLSVSGKLSNPAQPDIALALNAAALDIDRLFPQPADEHIPAPPPGSSDPQSANRSARLPPLALDSTAALRMQAGRAQFRGLDLADLKLDLLYRRGSVEHYRVNTRIDGGDFKLSGSADLRDPGQIRFVVQPDIAAVPLRAIAPVFAIEKLPIEGPLALKGELRGHAGSGVQIASHLSGKLDASLGRGTLNSSGRIGHFFEKLFSTIRIRNLFSGRLFRDLSSDGVPFESIAAQLSFEKGLLDLGGLRFSSDVMTIEGQGSVDLVDEGLKFEALLVPLVTMDDALNLVPLVGKALEDVSRIQIHVEGSLAEPRIHMEEAREIGQSIETEVEEPAEELKGVGRDLEKMF